MQQSINYKKLLKKIIGKSQTPTILEIGSDFKHFISDAINLSKNKNLFIHATNFSGKEENYKNRLSRFYIFKVKFGKNINKNNEIYNLDLIFSYLKWSKIDLLKINQNEFSIDILKGGMSILVKAY